MNKQDYPNKNKHSPPLLPFTEQTDSFPFDSDTYNLKSAHDKMMKVLYDAIQRIEWHISLLPQQPSAQQWGEVAQSFDNLVKLYHRLLNYHNKLQDLDPFYQGHYRQSPDRLNEQSSVHRQQLIDDIMSKLAKYQKANNPKK